MLMKINKPKGEILLIDKTDIFYKKNDKTYILDVFTELEREIENFSYFGEVFSYELNNNIIYSIRSINDDLIDKTVNEKDFLKNYIIEISKLKNSIIQQCPVNKGVKSCYFDDKIYIYENKGIISICKNDKIFVYNNCDYKVLQPFIIYGNQVYNQIFSEFSETGYISDIYVNKNFDLFIEYKIDKLHLLDKNCKKIALILIRFMKKKGFRKCLLIVFKILFYC